MPRTTPESVFTTAQQAMERGDWKAFFECLDRSDLMRLATMGLPLGGDPGDAYYALCIEHRIPPEALDRVKALGKDIQTSALATLPTWVGPESASVNREERLKQSLRHRDLVKDLDKAVATCLKSVKNLPAFTAAAEKLKRATMGGGSVSSTLFVGDNLVDVTAAGSKASGTRVLKGGHKEPIAFVRKKGVWYIKFMPRSRSRPK